MSIERTKKARRAQEYGYDICLSFAGENRAYVKDVAEHLSARGIRVFYDSYEKVELWGKDLYEHLDHIYREAARYCVVFISRHYAKKLWTNHERKSAQARAFRENAEYILPVRFDGTKLTGLLETVGYIDIRRIPPKELGSLIIKKLLPHKLLQFQAKTNFLPPEPDKLHRLLKVRNLAGKKAVNEAARRFVDALSRLDADERQAVALLLMHGCPHDIPKNIHIHLDLLRRLLKWPPSKVQQVLSGIASLGFDVEVKTRKKKFPESYLHLRWSALNPDIVIALEESSTSSTHVARAMVELVQENYCELHALEQITRGNFSSISSVTTEPDRH